MKVHGGVHVYIHIFLASVLVGGEWSATRPSCFIPEQWTLGIHWLGGWFGPRAGLDGVKNRKFLTLPGVELQPSVLQPAASPYTD
jgi:hypothetical protein